MVDIAFPSEIFEKLPEALRCGDPIGVTALIFTQGINERQTLAAVLKKGTSLEYQQQVNVERSACNTSSSVRERLSDQKILAFLNNLDNLFLSARDWPFSPSKDIGALVRCGLLRLPGRATSSILFEDRTSIIPSRLKGVCNNGPTGRFLKSLETKMREFSVRRC